MNTESRLDQTHENRLEYTKAMIDYATADLRQVYLRVTAALAIAKLFVTQIPIHDLHALHRWPTRELFIGLGCLVFASGMYFLYVDRTHLARREIARCLLNTDPRDTKKPDQILSDVFKTWRWSLWLANPAFCAGIGLLSVVLYALIAQQ